MKSDGKRRAPSRKKRVAALKHKKNEPPKDFCAFILTHGRPDRVHTIKTLRSHGYTGPIYIVIDDEDQTENEYRERFGDMVIQFSKQEVAKTFDEGDNFNDRRAIIYARNACFGLAQNLGYRYFIQLDDDYTSFWHRFNDKLEYGDWHIKSLNDVFSVMLDYFKEIPALSLAMSQGGDHIGGKTGNFAASVKTKRKAMNTFICDTQRPFSFFGRINEDVNTYTNLGRRGEIFLTINQVMMTQITTQSNSGGMTELYLDGGTYLKSFYSIMYSPSTVKVSDMGSSYRRLHHKIRWDSAAVKIIHESNRSDHA